LTLITGGARSGKSVFAEKLAAKSQLPVIYLATMEEVQSDPEAAERIRRHRERRPREWKTIERARRVHEVVDEFSADQSVCIFDCISLYVSNILLDGYSEDPLAMQLLEKETADAAAKLLTAIASKPNVHFIMVTNEVGAGIVPENGLARLYRDLLGVTNQIFAQAAHEVWLSAVGLQLKLKPQ
jgi:adenosylcobinamide kinase/adenosylcobinamide-phosphate guanylyltransferase